MSAFQPPPTWAELLLVDQQSGKVAFNPIWLNWFISLTQNVGATGPVNSVTATAPITSSGGANPNIAITGLGTMSTQNANAVAITGGAVDGTTIGATTPSVVKTTGLALSANGVVDVGASNIGLKRAFADYTNTATVGNVTINKMSGRVNLGAGAANLTVTNSLITAASHIFLNPDSAPGNLVAVLFFAVPAGGGGSFTVNAVPAVTNQTAIDFLVINAD